MRFQSRAVESVSLLFRNRFVFIALMSLAAIIKLYFSAMAPPSSDLQHITSYIVFNNSPWSTLEGQLFDLWRFLTGSPQPDPGKWWSTSPADMSSNFRLLSLLFRMPCFLADLGISLALYLVTLKLSRSKELSRLSSLVWFLNPYNFLAAELLGVPDVAVALLTVIATLLLLYRRVIPAALALAIAIALKLYPILLVPPLLLYVFRLAKSRWPNTIFLTLSCVVGVAGYLTWLSPYTPAVLSSDYTPVSQPLNLFIVSFAPGEGGSISLALVALVLAYLAIWKFMRRSELISMVSFTLLAYYLFSNPYPQYFIWVVPFLTLDIVLTRRSRGLLLTLLMVFLFAYWFIISYAFLTPSNYSLFLIPIKGSFQNIPPTSQAIVTFLNSLGTKILLLPLFMAGLYATVLIYCLDIILRDWLKVATRK